MVTANASGVKLHINNSSIFLKIIMRSARMILLEGVYLYTRRNGNHTFNTIMDNTTARNLCEV